MSGPPPPRVSVLVTCRDLGRWLPEAMASVVAQTFTDWEVVLVDDGSTDPETAALLDRASWPRTRLLRTPNRGVAAARNLALAESGGALVSALDADDRYRPEFLARAVAALDADPGLSFVSAWAQVFGDEDWVWRPSRCDLPALLVEDTVLTAAVARREAVVAAGGWDGEMGIQGYEDWNLWLAIVAGGGRGAILPEILFDYRRRAGSMSATCTVPAAHLELVSWLHRRHAPAYRANLEAVLERLDEATGELLRANDAVEREIAGRLEPVVALRRREVERLRARLASLRAAGEARDAMAARLFELDAARHRAEERVRALEASWSWRLTAPLRWALDRVRGTDRGDGT